MTKQRAIRGVNLGGWLVLEKWMTPSLFKGMAAVDEYTYCERADAAGWAALARHRDGFVTEADFAWMAAQGLTAVRLPVGYWVFGEAPPFRATISYVDKVFAWAETHKLQVLLSMHGAPGSQNGQGHSGRTGPVAWADDPAGIERTVLVVRRLAERYAASPALWGIELLNEPSRHLPKRLVQAYYRRAYAAIRKAAPPACRVVVSAGYQAWRWPFTLARPWYRRTVMDTHRYAIYLDADKRRSAAAHIRRTRWWLPVKLAAMGLTHRVVVGEWSAAFDEGSLTGLDATGREAAYRAYATAQLRAYARTSGWFYWNYKAEGGAPWNYRDTVDRGWLPAHAGGSDPPA